jgi:DNA-binding NtrC family response regulator
MKGNLLIVDDEPLLLKKLKLNLEDYADIIFTAQNGRDALHILETKEVHCIVCDINMPLMNGVEVLKEIREKKSDTPFIFYTGHGNKELMLEAAKYGAFDFLDKPNLDGLEEVVERGLKHGQFKSTSELNDSIQFISEYTKLLNKLDK